MTIFAMNVQEDTHCPCCTLFECTDGEQTYWMWWNGSRYTLDFNDPRTSDETADWEPLAEYDCFQDLMTKLYELFGY